ncbi:MAG: fumarate hydratase [Methanobacterium sp.]|nr:fumarate hydratase [Methanobacterium sp.]
MDLINLVKNAVIKASTTFREDQIKAYHKAITNEVNPLASWILKLLIENAQIANEKNTPLCDDTGVPHVILEIGEDSIIPANFIPEIKEGIKMGLQELPGRPMAVRGNDLERIEQKKGLYNEPGKLIPSSFIIDQLDIEKNPNNQDKIRIHILMLGGGPEIRARTHSIFHKRDYNEIFEEIKKFMKLELPKLGCTPCIPAVGVGRTHFEATSLMLKAMAYGNLEIQSELERDLTKTINSYQIGALNLGGSVTALGSFINIGPQRASGVRILSIRPCCCVEPRVSSFDFHPHD